MGVGLCIWTPHGGGPYSSCGRTVVLYAASRIHGCLVLIFLLTNPIRGNFVYVCIEV